QKLGYDTTTCRAQRQPNAELLRSPGASSQEQICEICAYDQQNHVAGSHQDGNWCEQQCLCSEMRVPHRENRSTNALIGIGVRFSHSAGQCFDLITRLTESNSGS